MLFSSEGHVAQDRNPGPGYNTIPLPLISGYRLYIIACPHSQFHTLTGLLDSRLHCKTPTLRHAYLYREAVCTIFMMVLGMTWLGREYATYRMRGGYTSH